MAGLILCLLLGLALAVGSAFYMFAIGMSDSPGEGNPKMGCGLAVLGAAVFVVSLIAIIARLF